jgi:hypothetical protein
MLAIDIRWHFTCTFHWHGPLWWLMDVSITCLSTRFCVDWWHCKIWGSHGGDVNITIFWDVNLCSLVDHYLHFRGTCCFHFPNRTVHQATWHHTEEDIRDLHYILLGYSITESVLERCRMKCVNTVCVYILSRVSDRRRVIGLSTGFITHKQLHIITIYTLYDSLD